MQPSKDSIIKDISWGYTEFGYKWQNHINQILKKKTYKLYELIYNNTTHINSYKNIQNHIQAYKTWYNLISKHIKKSFKKGNYSKHIALMYSYILVCVHSRMYIYVYTHMYMCMYVCMSVFVYLCIYIYICVCQREKDSKSIASMYS